MVGGVPQRKWPEDFINKVICGDCLEILPLIPDGAVDAVITDPPYGVRKKEDWDDENHFRSQINDWVRGCRVTAPRVIWFCAGKMLPYIVENSAESLFRVLIWNKPAGSQYAGASHNNLWYSNELILLFGDSDAWKEKGTNSIYSGSVFDSFPEPMKTFGHPTTKPIGLMRWLISHHTDPGDLIIDPFCGSGSTLVAAKQLNRRYIGIEISPEYCKIAEDRLRQGELFNQ